MFQKPDGKTKRILQGDKSSTCGYVYPDGVAIKHETSHAYGPKNNRQYGKIEYVDLFPCEIPIWYRNRVDKTIGSSKFKGRIVFHNPTLLINGINRIEIYEGNNSDSMKAKGLVCTTITITTGDGMKIRIDQFDFLHSDICIQEKREYDWATGIQDFVFKGQTAIVTEHGKG